MGVRSWRFPGLARRARAKHELLIAPVRETARKCGYAIAVHGSLARDLDWLAVPWTGEAVSATEFAVRVIRTIKRLIGRAPKDAPWWQGRGKKKRPAEAWFKGHVEAPSRRRRDTKRKPHGRRVWVIHLGGGPYVDLSVMPRRR